MPWHLIVALTAVMAMLASCGVDNRPPAERAEAAFANGHYAEARVHLANAIDAAPNDPDLRIFLGRAALAQGDGVVAETAFERALELDSDRADELAPYLAHAHLLQGEADAALARLGEAGGSTLYAQRIRAQAHLQKGEADAAWDIIETALSAAGDDPDLLALAGQYRLSTGNIADAEHYARRSLASDTPSVESYLLMGRIASIRGDLQGALGHYAAGVERFPEHVQLHIARAAIHADRGEADEMDVAMAQIERIAPGHPAAIFIAAKDALNRGELDRARELAPALEEAARDAPPLQLLLGELAIRLGNNEQGIRWLTEFRRFDPYHSKAAFLLAHALMDTGSARQAHAAIATAAGRATASPQVVALAARLADELSHESAEMLARRAAAPDLAEAADGLRAAQQAMTQNDWPAAARHYGALIQRGYGDHPLILNNAAMANLRAERGETALELAERAHALVPDDPSVLDTLGWVTLETGGNRSEALTMLRRAARLDPGNAQIRWHLAQALAINGQREDARRLAGTLLALISGEQREQIEAFREGLG
ncbi:tetratricopeptide repeat protein [Parasphingopyxis sp.]|uniref:tetratricopeptide repeat protein n=1 Tax=Parasphingopyxis sp. TaxID=1920299 RepID=UPI00261A2CE3|nr:tetratricopeptide repeat protein [Parasphingopyxis sp.]